MAEGDSEVLPLPPGPILTSVTLSQLCSWLRKSLLPPLHHLLVEFEGLSLMPMAAARPLASAIDLDGWTPPARGPLGNGPWSIFYTPRADALDDTLLVAFFLTVQAGSQT